MTGSIFEFKCDLIDHDTTGDVRFYSYTDKENPVNPLSKVKLIEKYESHTGSILSVDFID